MVTIMEASQLRREKEAKTKNKSKENYVEPLQISKTLKQGSDKNKSCKIFSKKILSILPSLCFLIQSFNLIGGHF